MGIQTGSYHRPTYQAAAPRFAGGSAGAGTSPKPPVTTPTPNEKISFFKAIRLAFSHLKNEFKDPQTKEVIKGFGLKHLPEMAMTGLCALPGVGWVANMVLIPISMKLSKNGGKMLDEADKKLNKNDNSMHRGLRHLINMDKAWNNPDPKRQYFSKVDSAKPNKEKLTLSKYLSTKYNKAVEGIFNKDKNPALVNKLKIEPTKERFIYRNFERWTEAGQSLRQTRFLGRIFRWMSGISKNQVSKAFMSRFVRLFFLVPRVTLQGLFYLFKKKPKFP